LTIARPRKVRAGQAHEHLRRGVNAAARLLRHFTGAAAHGWSLSAVHPWIIIARRCAISRRHVAIPHVNAPDDAGVSVSMAWVAAELPPVR
jgi:hypothetical protein